MLKEKTITLRLKELGYLRCGRFIYKASWSAPDVEHYLYFSTYGSPKEFLAGDFGVRNEAAQSFGVKCVRAYGGAIYRLVEQDEPMRCYMRFPLGKIAGWSPRWSLTLSNQPEADLVDLISEAVRYQLFPVIREVTNLGRLLSLLEKDEEPVRWVHVNGAMRAAQIAYLARLLGMGTAEIRSMLRRRENELVAHLRGATLDCASYIERIIDDAEVSLRVRNPST
ncbi:hypothetical protein JQ628_04590 [Bradyrhizobium lablabi]|uniref:hypothetical protein n=1 Tax=Bradyrhizobium lablabi TaxID=722472 RepID=UPI001BA7A2C8|nr:hypothetical protein [Bradyrhizobium lablabi]MBR1120784.1 hypothetical protein [Bradyrhizobium lablabi]